VAINFLNVGAKNFVAKNNFVDRFFEDTRID